MILDWCWFAFFAIVSVFAPPVAAFWVDKDDYEMAFVVAAAIVSNILCGLISSDATFVAFFHWLNFALPQQGTPIHSFTAGTLSILLYIAYFAATLLLGYILAGRVWTSRVVQEKVREAAQKGAKLAARPWRFNGCEEGGSGI